MSEIKMMSILGDDQTRINRHLAFIKHLTNTSIQFGYRPIVVGGYAVDGILGMITRPHANINIVIYGKDVITVTLLKERILTGAYQSYTVEEKERGLLCHEFYIPEVQACIYYVAVATNPFSDTNIVVRADGVYTEEEEYNSKIVVLDHVRYEVQGATEGLAERIYQRDHQGLLKNPKYDQDIHNLRSITDSYEVDFLVKQKIKKEKMGAHTNS